MIQELFVNIGEDFTIPFKADPTSDQFILYVASDPYIRAQTVISTGATEVSNGNFQFSYKIEFDSTVPGYKPKYYRIDAVKDEKVTTVINGRIFIKPTPSP